VNDMRNGNCPFCGHGEVVAARQVRDSRQFLLAAVTAVQGKHSLQPVDPVGAFSRVSAEAAVSPSSSPGTRRESSGGRAVRDGVVGRREAEWPRQLRYQRRILAFYAGPVPI
jgi:hypothetical protein